MAYEFKSLDEAAEVLDELVSEVQVNGFVGYLCPRTCGKELIDPMVVSACEEEGLEAFSYDDPSDLFEMHYVTTIGDSEERARLERQCEREARAEGLIR